MDRVRDYTGFAVWFAGLGYIVLWPMTSPDFGGRPFGASIFCRENSRNLLDLLCNSAHTLRLPPALHVLGFLAAVFVAIRLLCFAVRRLRSRRAPGAAMVTARLPAAVLPPPPRKPAYTPRPVKPRTQFGLRGTTQ